MQIYELFEVSSSPKKSDCRYANHRVYNNSLYIEAECLVDCNDDVADDITDEEFDMLVEKELKGIIETLETHGRYPVTGIPKYVMY